jgi:hypothetical protein
MAAVEMNQVSQFTKTYYNILFFTGLDLTELANLLLLCLFHAVADLIALSSIVYDN